MKKKNTTSVLFAVIFVILIAGVVVIATGYENFSFSNNKELYETISENVYNSVEDIVKVPLDTCRELASDSELTEILKSEDDISDSAMVVAMTDYLSAFKDKSEADAIFCTSDSSDKYFSDTELIRILNPNGYAYDKWYDNFLALGVDYCIDIDTDPVNGDTWTIFVDHVVRDENGKLLGVATISMPAKGLQEVLEKYESEYEVKVIFVDTDGVVVVDTESINIDTTQTDTLNNVNDNQQHYYVAADGSEVVMRYMEDLGLYLVVRDKKTS